MDVDPATALLVRSTPSTPAHRRRPAGRMRRKYESIREADGINLVDEGDAFGLFAQDDVPAGENSLTWTTTYTVQIEWDGGGITASYTINWVAP